MDAVHGNDEPAVGFGRHGNARPKHSYAISRVDHRTIRDINSPLIAFDSVLLLEGLCDGP